MVVGLIVAFGVIGSLLFIGGLRGRRVDDHPWCRQCRFDLFGSPSRSSRCPECGANLDSRRAVRHGRRKRRPVVLSSGALLLVIAGTLIALQVSGVGSKVNWIAYKPAWWLAIEARSPELAKSDAALKELGSRLRRDTLSQSRIDGLVKAAMSRFESPQVEVSRYWDAFMLSAWGLGHLDEPTARAYADGLFQPEIVLEPATHNGRPAAVVGCRVTPARSIIGRAHYLCDLVTLSADGVAIELPAGRTLVQNLNEAQPHLLSPCVNLQVPGPHRVQATAEWTLATEPLRERGASGARPGRVVYRQQYVFDEPAATPSVAPLEFYSDLETRAALIDAMSMTLYAAQGEGRKTPTLYVHFSMKNAPVALDADLQIQSLTGEVLHSRHLETRITNGSQTPYNTGFTLYLGKPGVMLPSVDFVLTTGRAAYPTTSGPTVSPIRFWCDEIHLCDVPVQWIDRDTPDIADAIRSNLGVDRIRPSARGNTRSR